ncbi:Iron-siderophore ABC transporter permease [Fusobacterium necrophorum subsp. funduliforme]|uniref:Iron-siderophore ABC transporter permease n=1 Tax=Fusobacterium necrophorum BL TaxID=1441732 RepID=A0AB73BY13_9FUSO|nr:iron ABC transporter permease [Fusobacterium necrophorum]AYZ74462.1 iron ABC transporter permease [Fusobacterium necrophorum]AZW09653.1 iron ABC transporter permease [Fusobacterium necrophorum subsp. necrophorum]KDE64544.1 iron-siderophore ABC transporter permease [Fusobacterium necrophorum BL]KDE69756.1 iron-siderophore ABC transporter permease [Fusobacterium necrophorum DAB]KDE72044.1 iron-siderophore ABC transporter permease [Fusobacterium necrophorum BFTR-2]
MEHKLTGEEMYRKINRKRRLTSLFTLIAIVVALLLDLFIGSSGMSLVDILVALWQGPGVKSIESSIIWNIRLPMTLICLTVGASLGLAGTQMQTILANPLASPYTLGVSSAAGFGAAIAFISGFPFQNMSWVNAPFMAFMMTLAGTMAIYFLGKVKGMRAQSMVLFGIVTHFFFQALLSLVQFRSTPEVAGQIVYWMFGSLLKATWTGVFTSGAIFLLCALLLSRYAWKLTALSAGEERAKSLGIDTDKVRLHVFLISSLLTAGAVAFVGTIGFIGLVAPHFARYFAGEDQRYLAPMASLFGVLLIAFASILAKLVIPGIIIPIGIVTSLVGVPFLVFLIIRKGV